MNTIRVSVKSGTDLQLLIRLLKSMNMVISVEEEQVETVDQESQYQKINYVLKKYASSSLFSKIVDPVNWQREMRDEWH
nr:hypothetical protein [Bacteroidota bacterium]